MGFAAKPRDPTLENWQGQVFNTSYGIGRAGKWGKKFINRFEGGQDVSDMGELADIRSRESAAQGDLNLDYMTGVNALVGQGSDTSDVSQLNRQRDLARERIHQGAGRESIAARGQLFGQALETYQDAFDSARQLEQNAQLGAANNRLGYYGQRYQYKQPFWQQAVLAGIAGGSQIAAAAV